MKAGADVNKGNYVSGSIVNFYMYLQTVRDVCK